MQHYEAVTLGVVLPPLFGGIIAGLFKKKLGQIGAQTVTILGVATSLIFSLWIASAFFLSNSLPYQINVYTWVSSDVFQFHIGFLVDALTAIMFVTVNTVSLLVHVYSVGYMRDDPGYQRFFSYMSLFTFAMLMLVGANNFLQLFFGWEAVGLVSYLLIGFWFKKEAATAGSMKAFIVNRIGDFGFVLGIALIFSYAGTLDYTPVFKLAPSLAAKTITVFPGIKSSLVTAVCMLLFIGAMGKSAQMPLHVWLPESMEGPTPISALIHAATMVTAGVYLVARMSPLFEYSATALNLVLIIGATGALFTGLIAVVQDDIKRVIAYSTLSQLGYMMVAVGASAYAAGIFHLFTHAFFKALLFLAAGSVIIGMHHEQDMQKMGNLRRYMPITYVTFLTGALALSGIPPFSGYYSKDAIIEAVHLSSLPAAHYAYLCVLLGAFVTAFYIFRALFLVFHTQERMHHTVRQKLKESPWVMVVPLVLLAVPSLLVGMIFSTDWLYRSSGLLTNSLLVLPAHDVLAQLRLEYHGPWSLLWQAFTEPPFWLAVLGIAFAWLFYIKRPYLPGYAEQKCPWLHRILLKKYGFDEFNQVVFTQGSQLLAKNFYEIGDIKILDNQLVNGSGHAINWVSRAMRKLQTGLLYDSALIMVVGLLVLLVLALSF